MKNLGIMRLLFSAMVLIIFIGCGGGSSSDTTLPAGSTTPTNNVIEVNAGEDKTIELGETIILEAKTTMSGSYMWVEGESMVDGQTIISSNSQYTFTAKEVGVFPFSVQVKNSDGFARDTVVITVKDINLVENGTKFGNFGVTQLKYETSANREEIIQNIFGSDYKVADWNDLKRYYSNSGDLKKLFEELNVNQAFVTRDGSEKTGSRYYFASLHNHNKPGSYLAHDNIDNYLISLGSWYSANQILVIKKYSSTDVNLTNGLVAHYEFEGDANDSSGNGNNGTEHGGVSYSDGVIGQAGSFDGVDDYIWLGTSQRFNPSKTTVSSWVKPMSDMIGGYVYRWRLFGIGIYVKNNKISFMGYTSDNATSEQKENTIEYTIDTNSWLHFVYEYDGNQFTLFINGIKVYTFNKKGNLYYEVGGVSIGRDGDYNNHYFSGLVDDLRIYNRALSEIEIQELYKLGETNSTDTDNDGISDTRETELGLNIDSNDSDNDGILDLVEVVDINNPTDTDNDEIIDALDEDSDNDGYSDKNETASGTNPTDVSDYPGKVDNQAPTVNAGEDKTGILNSAITLTGTATDSDGTVASYEWKEGNSVLATTASFSYTPTSVGSHTLTLTVTDNDGSSNSDSLVITVNTNSTPTRSFLLKKTGQTKSYDANGNEVTDGTQKDDGHYQVGRTPSYTRDNGNETVTDNLTGLEWQDDASVASVTKPWLTIENYLTCNNDSACFDTTGDTATTYCDELVLGRFEDWRLPTRVELKGLIDYGRFDPSINIAFVNTTSDLYWSSTTSSNDSSSAWLVSFKSGSQNFNIKGYNTYVRCVREGQ